ncbi:hypothetical protein [Corallococcus sp. CA049B]|uniref:hypothetical protein n=1 Tax=Corallococcus sp. CA049B TaxID=2316730 RepID=UPI001F298D9F|nr:hypothetical protein [Corallococcus sp. CA049B]
MYSRNTRFVAMLVAALALVGAGCGGGAHARASAAEPSATAVYLAQAQCGPQDSTVSCCVKTHPGNPARCGATDFEAEEILFGARVAKELAREDLPEWKRYCMNEYAKCQEQDWIGSCYDCFRSCEGQQGEWPHDRCFRQRKGR